MNFKFCSNDLQSKFKILNKCIFNLIDMCNLDFEIVFTFEYRGKVLIIFGLKYKSFYQTSIQR